MNNKITVIRDTYSDMGTFGKLYIDGKFFCYTVEQLWKDNLPEVSCIPEGTYQLKLRFSPIVQKSSDGEFSEGYEITNVPGRKYVMVHAANTFDQLKACLACGDSLGFVNNKWAVLNSKTTFKKLMHKLEEKNDWEMLITNIFDK